MHCNAWASSSIVALSHAENGSQAQSLNSTSRSMRPSRGCVFPNSLNELLLWYCPSVEITLWSNHCVNVLGILDNFHFSKLHTVVDTQSNSSWQFIDAILYTTALPLVEVEPSVPVDYQKRRQVAIDDRRDEAHTAKSACAHGEGWRK